MSPDASPFAVPGAPPPAELDALPSQTACVFTLSGTSCAIHLRQVREIVTIGVLTKVPGTPPVLLGVTNVRGTVVPVVDLRPLLGLQPGSIGAESPAVVLEDGDLRAALAVDRVVGLERFETALPPRETGGFARIACGALPSADGVVTLLDGPTILAMMRRLWIPTEDAVAT